MAAKKVQILHLMQNKAGWFKVDSKINGKKQCNCIVLSTGGSSRKRRETEAK